MPFCSQCGSKVEDYAIFCSNCGSKITNIEKAHNDRSTKSTLSFPMTFTVSRESQFTCSGTGYKVIINGQDLGKIGVGKTLATTINSEDVSIEIRCTAMLMTGIHATFQLKVTSSNPSVTFKLRYGGPIDATVHGAQILNFNGGHDGKYF